MAIKAPAKLFHMDGLRGKPFSHARTKAPEILNAALGKVRNKKVKNKRNFMRADSLFGILPMLHTFEIAPGERRLMGILLVDS